MKANEVMAEKTNCYTSNNCRAFAENGCKLRVSMWMIVVDSNVFLKYAKAIATANFFLC